MIRNIHSNKTTVSWTRFVSRTCSTAIVLATAFTVALPATEAAAQSGYLARDPNVNVDMSVLDSLGGPPTRSVTRQPLPGQQSPTRQQQLPGRTSVFNGSLLNFPPPRPPVSRLTGRLANRPLNPAPVLRRQTSVAPSRSVAPSPAAAPVPRVTVQTPVPPPPVPAPANIVARAVEPTATPEPVPEPPAMPEPPAATPALPAPTATSPEPTPAPVVATFGRAPAAPPEPAKAEPAETAMPAPQDEPEPTPAPAVETASTTALTPSPTGPTPPASVPTISSPEGVSDAQSFRVLFDNQSAKISDSESLQALSNTLKQSENLRVQLLAYAAGTEETASQARRLSLSRALAVRSFLISQGVRSTRMDVRALGNKVESGPANRVDAVLVSQ